MAVAWLRLPTPPPHPPTHPRQPPSTLSTHVHTPARELLFFVREPAAAYWVVTDSELAAFRSVKAELLEAVKREGSVMTLRRGPATGLINQGATCYMNSLLQALFWTPEFRALLYKVREGVRYIGMCGVREGVRYIGMCGGDCPWVYPSRRTLFLAGVDGSPTAAQGAAPVMLWAAA